MTIIPISAPAPLVSLKTVIITLAMALISFIILKPLFAKFHDSNLYYRRLLDVKYY
jgi:hypothetical protein